MSLLSWSLADEQEGSSSANDQLSSDMDVDPAADPTLTL